jgi:outer membrane lipoprotein-sorting protein
MIHYSLKQYYRLVKPLNSNVMHKRSIAMQPTALIIILFTSLAGDSSEPAKDQLTANMILEQMATTYSSCKTYTDTGLVSTIYFEGHNKRTVKQPFSTSFIRPDAFRFECKEKAGFFREHLYIVCREERKTRTWWDVTPGVKVAESLGLALAGATGVSGGSAHTIPALLIPEEVSGQRLTDITHVKLIEDEILDNIRCFCIQGQFGGNPITLWIEKNTFLLRKMVTENEYSDFHTQSTTTYRPVIDEEVPPKMLQFDPPK